MSQWLYYLDAIGMTLLGILFMALAIVVFLQDPRSHIHRAFAGIMTDLYVIDMLEILRLATIDPDIHLLSYRLTFAVAVLMIATVLYFAQVFPDDPELPVFWRNFIFIGAAVVALLIAFSPNVITGMAGTPQYLGDYPQFRAGQGYLWLRWLLLANLLFAIFSLFFKWLKAEGVRRVKLAYVLTAIFISGGFSVVALLLFPWLQFNIHRAIPIAVTLGALIALVGILRYRLFRIIPSASAEQILDTLSDTVLALDLDGRIVFGQVKEAAELEPFLYPVVEMVIAGKKVGNYHINFKGRYFAVNAGFISEGGGVLVVLNDISEMERSLTEQDLIREKLVKRLEKETIIRRTLSALAQVKEAEEIRSIIPPVEISSDPELMQAISRLEKATRNRLELLGKSQRDRRELLKKVEEAERVYNAGVQRELEVVELREKIRKLKEAKGIL